MKKQRILCGIERGSEPRWADSRWQPGSCLNQLVPEAARSDRAIGGTLELPRNGKCAPLVAHVFPFAAHRHTSIFDTNRPAVAVFVVEVAADLGPQIQRFAATFGLTPGETRVLGEVISGKGLQATAAQLKISETTARTHMNRIFSKTGTSRQTELIRRKSAFPAAKGKILNG